MDCFQNRYPMTLGCSDGETRLNSAVAVDKYVLAFGYTSCSDIKHSDQTKSAIYLRLDTETKELETFRADSTSLVDALRGVVHPSDDSVYIFSEDSGGQLQIHRTDKLLDVKS